MESSRVLETRDHWFKSNHSDLDIEHFYLYNIYMKIFWDKVNKTDTCWNWTASGRGQGYGVFRYEGKLYDSHRFSWYLKHNCWPEKWILHTCNNRKCVNPDHLYEGTPKQNYADMRNSGREQKRNKKYGSYIEMRRAGWKRWYERVKNEPGRKRYNRWRKTQKKLSIS